MRGRGWTNGATLTILVLLAGGAFAQPVPQDTLVWDVDASGTLTAGDLYLSGAQAGRFAAANDAQLNRILGSATFAPRAYSAKPAGFLALGDAVYEDLDLSGNVSPGDARWSGAGFGSLVAPGGADASRVLFTPRPTLRLVVPVNATPAQGVYLAAGAALASADVRMTPVGSSAAGSQVRTGDPDAGRAVAPLAGRLGLLRGPSEASAAPGRVLVGMSSVVEILVKGVDGSAQAGARVRLCGAPVAGCTPASLTDASGATGVTALPTTTGTLSVHVDGVPTAARVIVFAALEVVVSPPSPQPGDVVTLTVRQVGQPVGEPGAMVMVSRDGVTLSGFPRTTPSGGQLALQDVQPGRHVVSAVKTGFDAGTVDFVVPQPPGHRLGLSALRAPLETEVDEPMDVSVVVSNDAATDASAQLVLLVDGVERASKTIRVPADGATTATFPDVSFSTPGRHTVLVRLVDESLTSQAITVTALKSGSLFLPIPVLLTLLAAVAGAAGGAWAFRNAMERLRLRRRPPPAKCPPWKYALRPKTEWDDVEPSLVQAVSLTLHDATNRKASVKIEEDDLGPLNFALATRQMPDEAQMDRLVRRVVGAARELARTAKSTRDVDVVARLEGSKVPVAVHLCRCKESAQGASWEERRKLLTLHFKDASDAPVGRLVGVEPGAPPGEDPLAAQVAAAFGRFVHARRLIAGNVKVEATLGEG